MSDQRNAQIALRVAASFLATPPPKIVYLGKQIGFVQKALGAVDTHGKKLVKAQKVLQPLASKVPKTPLGKTYAKLEPAVGQLRALRKAGKDVIIELYRVERQAQAETSLVIKRYLDVEDYFDFDLDDVNPPTLTTLENRVNRYNTIVETDFKGDFSISAADSKGLETYARLIKGFDWKEMLIPKLEIDESELQFDIGDQVRDNFDE